MPVNFNNFTASAAIQETDQVVGFANTYSGGERRWTFGTLRATLVSGAASTIATSNLPASKILASDTNGKVTASAISPTELQGGLMPTGAVMAFAMQTPPEGWLACDGTPVSRTTYSKLLQAIGTIYGVGDGANTFNLPDLRGYFVRGTGTNSDGTAAGTFGLKQQHNWKSFTIANSFGPYTHGYDVGKSVSPNYSTSPGIFMGKWEAVQIGGVNNATQSVFSWDTTEIRPKNIALLYCIKF
jgi:microcystin-dependent protein